MIHIKQKLIRLWIKESCILKHVHQNISLRILRRHSIMKPFCLAIESLVRTHKNKSLLKHPISNNKIENLMSLLWKKKKKRKRKQKVVLYIPQKVVRCLLYNLNNNKWFNYKKLSQKNLKDQLGKVQLIINQEKLKVINKILKCFSRQNNHQ